MGFVVSFPGGNRIDRLGENLRLNYQTHSRRWWAVFIVLREQPHVPFHTSARYLKVDTGHWNFIQTLTTNQPISVNDWKIGENCFQIRDFISDPGKSITDCPVVYTDASRRKCGNFGRLHSNAIYASRRELRATVGITERAAHEGFPGSEMRFRRLGKYFPVSRSLQIDRLVVRVWKRKQMNSFENGGCKCRSFA